MTRPPRRGAERDPLHGIGHRKARPLFGRAFCAQRAALALDQRAHGEYRMLYQHAELANALGMAWENIFIPVSYTHLDVYKRQEMMTVSPGTISTSRCEENAMRVSADIGSPWLPVEMTTTRSGG